MLKRALIIFFSTALLAATQEKPPLGIVTGVQGGARIFDSGSKAGRDAEIADVLFSGYRLVTSNQGNVDFVFCPTGISVSVLPHSEVRIAADGFTLLHGNLGQQHNVPSCQVPAAHMSMPGSHVGGVTMRGERKLNLLSPAGDKISPDALIFRWKPMKSATDYRLSLSDEDGGEQFWEADSTMTSLAYAGKTVLRPGKNYLWRVTALSGDSVLDSSSAELTVFTTEDLTRIDQVRATAANDMELHLLLGMLYEQLHSPELALGQYEEIKPTKKQGWLAKKIIALRTGLGEAP